MSSKLKCMCSLSGPTPILNKFKDSISPKETGADTKIMNWATYPTYFRWTARERPWVSWSCSVRTWKHIFPQKFKRYTSHTDLEYVLFGSDRSSALSYSVYLSVCVILVNSSLNHSLSLHYSHSILPQLIDFTRTQDWNEIIVLFVSKVLLLSSPIPVSSDIY